MGKINVYDKIVMKKRKKENMEIEQIVYINIHLKEDFGMEFAACLCELMPEGAMTPFTACDAYLYFAGRALLMTPQK